MAATTLTRPRGDEIGTQAQLRYRILREKMNQAAAVANALRDQQEEGTHAYYLAQLLDSMMGEAKCWLVLDEYFGVDENGDDVVVNHG